MVSRGGGLAEAFAAAAAMNMCATHTPAHDEATETVVDVVVRRAAGGVVAIAVGDAVLDTIGVEEALRAAGCDVLRADDPSWRERLPDAAVGVTGATVAVVEQGVVGLASGPGSPRGASLLPPAHVCVVRAGDIVATFAEAIELVAARPLPSALSWIGGPSRTGDLGMTLTLGVHGPGAVDVVVAPEP